MAIPSIAGLGSGVVIATGSASVTKTLCVAGNIIFVQCLQDGSGTGPTLTLASGSNIENLAGTDDAMDLVVNGSPVGAGSTGNHFLWIGRCHTTGTCTVTLATGGDDLYARMYELTDAATGTTLATVIENGAATHGTTQGDTATLSDVAVVTNAADRLAISFYAVNDDNAVSDFSGETGGNWTAAGEFASATGTDGCIGLQTAGMASAGTIDGGTATMAAIDAWSVVGLAIRPAAAGPVVLPPPPLVMDYATSRSFDW